MNPPALPRRRRRLTWKDGYTDWRPRSLYQGAVLMLWLGALGATVWLALAGPEGYRHDWTTTAGLLIALLLPPPRDRRPWGSKHSLWILGQALLLSIVLSLALHWGDFVQSMKKGFEDGKKAREQAAQTAGQPSPTPTPAPTPVNPS